MGSLQNVIGPVHRPWKVNAFIRFLILLVIQPDSALFISIDLMMKKNHLPSQSSSRRKPPGEEAQRWAREHAQVLESLQNLAAALQELHIQSATNISSRSTPIRLSHYRRLPPDVQQTYELFHQGAALVHATCTKYTLMGPIDPAAQTKMAQGDLLTACQYVATSCLALHQVESTGCARSAQDHVRRAARAVLATVVALVQTFVEKQQQHQQLDDSSENNDQQHPTAEAADHVAAQRTGAVWEACDYITQRRLPMGNRNAMRRDLLTWLADCQETIQEFQELLEAGPLLEREELKGQQQKEKNNNNDDEPDDNLTKIKESRANQPLSNHVGGGEDAADNQVEVDHGQQQQQHDDGRDQQKQQQTTVATEELITPEPDDWEAFLTGQDDMQYTAREIPVATACVAIIKCSRGSINLAMMACDAMGDTLAHDGGDDSGGHHIPEHDRARLQWIGQLHDLARAVGEGMTDLGACLYPPLQYNQALLPQVQRQAAAVEELLQFVADAATGSVDGGDTNGAQEEAIVNPWIMPDAVRELLSNVQGAINKRKQEAMQAISCAQRS